MAALLPPHCLLLATPTSAGVVAAPACEHNAPGPGRLKSGPGGSIARYRMDFYFCCAFETPKRAKTNAHRIIVGLPLLCPIRWNSSLPSPHFRTSVRGPRWLELRSQQRLLLFLEALVSEAPYQDSAAFGAITSFQANTLSLAFILTVFN